MHRARLSDVRRAAALAVFVLLAACASTTPVPRASSVGDDTAALFVQLNALRREADALPNALARMNFYRDAWARSGGGLRNFLGQTYAAEEAALGRYAEAVADFPQGRAHTREPAAPLPAPAEFEAVDAVDAIADLAAARRIVAINEAHHVAQSRVLTLALLPRLRALGYTHFAAESLHDQDAGLAARGYPTDASGPYVQEPLYGELIRQALKLGYVVVPYESKQEPPDPEAREAGQADNLYRRVFEGRADARLLVHGGYAHVHKRGGYLFGVMPMAARLGRRVGSVALSVDQTFLRPSAPGRELDAYAQLIATYAPDRASVLRARRGQDVWSLEPAYYDVSVLQPRELSIKGRPAWLDLGGTRRAVAVDDRWCRDVAPCLVEARYAGESAAAVPADRLVRTNAPGGDLYLFPGRYSVRATDAAGRRLADRDIDVAAR